MDIECILHPSVRADGPDVGVDIVACCGESQPAAVPITVQLPSISDMVVCSLAIQGKINLYYTVPTLLCITVHALFRLPV